MASVSPMSLDAKATPAGRLLRGGVRHAMVGGPRCRGEHCRGHAVRGAPPTSTRRRRLQLLRQASSRRRRVSHDMSPSAARMKPSRPPARLTKGTTSSGRRPSRAPTSAMNSRRSPSVSSQRARPRDGCRGAHHQGGPATSQRGRTAQVDHHPVTEETGGLREGPVRCNMASRIDGEEWHPLEPHAGHRWSGPDVGHQRGRGQLRDRRHPRERATKVKGWASDRVGRRSSAAGPVRPDRDRTLRAAREPRGPTAVSRARLHRAP